MATTQQNTLELELEFEGLTEVLNRYFTMKVPASDVEDLVQETLLQATRSRSTYRGDSSVRGFVLQIARNVLLHFYRRRARKEGRLEFDPSFGEQLVDPAPSPEDEAARNEQSRILFSSLEGLSRADGLVVWLVFFEGKSITDVANALQVNKSTVSRRLRRALRDLHDGMASTGSSPSSRTPSQWRERFLREATESELEILNSLAVETP